MRDRGRPGGTGAALITSTDSVRCLFGAHATQACRHEREPSTGVFVSDEPPRSGIHELLRSNQESSTTVTRTFTPKAGEIQREWLVIDATDVVLGRLASHAAVLLRGKHKASFAPHVDTGDFVIVVNADKVALTGQKLQKKMAYRHSGYPGGLKAVSYEELLEKNPVRAVEKAIRGMLPKNSLGRQQLSKLKVYAGAEHPHAAQQPTTYTFDQVAQ
jgi:large subunit ribosomal protein L13